MAALRSGCSPNCMSASMKLTLVVLEGFLIESHRLDDVMRASSHILDGGGQKKEERGREGEDESLPH